MKRTCRRVAWVHRTRRVLRGFDRLGNYDLDGRQSLDDNRLRDAAVKLSWQASRSSQLSYLYYMNNKGQFHRVSVPAGDYSDSRATYLDDKYPSVHQVKLTATLSPRLVMDVSSSLMHGVDRFLGTTNRFSPDLVRPHTNEYSVELEQQLPGQMLATVGYFHRSTRANFGSRNLLVPTTSYVPLQVTEVTSGRQVTVYNQDPATRGRFDVLWDNEAALDTDYGQASGILLGRMIKIGATLNF